MDFFADSEEDIKKEYKPCRKWCLTINNPETHGFSHDVIRELLMNIKNVKYWCMCDEIGLQTHTYHTHIFIYRDTAISFEYLKKLFPPAFLKACNGSALENRAYVRKEGAKFIANGKVESNLPETFEEFGECPEEKQGKRNDLTLLYDLVKQGKSDFEIIEENPNFMNRLNTVGQVRETLKYEQYKNKVRDTMHVEYWQGDSGTGKTSGIYNLYGFENVYRVTDYKNPWDGYSGQDVVVFEEFRGEIEISKMLIWLDIYPLQLPCRYNNKTACYTKVFFTSNKPLKNIYTEWQKDEPETFKAFTRRIHTVKIFAMGQAPQEIPTQQYIDGDVFVNISAAEEKYIQETFGL